MAPKAPNIPGHDRILPAEDCKREIYLLPYMNEGGIL